MGLGVNVDHVATIREARRTSEPDPVVAAALAELAGVPVQRRDAPEGTARGIAYLAAGRPARWGGDSHEDVFTPRGAPVEPDVYCKIARSSGEAGGSTRRAGSEWVMASVATIAAATGASQAVQYPVPQAISRMWWPASTARSQLRTRSRSAWRSGLA